MSFILFSVMLETGFDIVSIVSWFLLNPLWCGVSIKLMHYWINLIVKCMFEITRKCVQIVFILCIVERIKRYATVFLYVLRYCMRI